MLPNTSRRSFLAGASGAALLPFLACGTMVLAQDATTLIIGQDADIAGLDPANRVGGTDTTVIRAVCQNLASFKAEKLEWELDAAKTLTQVSDTELTFELNPGQMFQGGYGEMTADDEKYALERHVSARFWNTRSRCAISRWCRPGRC